MSLVSMYIRYSFGKNDRKRDAGLKTPEDVKRFDDIPYGDDRKYQILDVYRPLHKEGKLPVIVSFHGGGWVYGTKETYQFYCVSLAQRGFAVVNFSYRLSPEHKYPAQIEDCNTVMKWVMDHEDEYGFDLNNIFAVGDSAGGHLLSVYCAMLNDQDYAKAYGIETPALSFGAVGLNCGIYKEEVPTKNDNNAKLMDTILGKGWTKEDLDLFNSYDKVNEKFPPCFVMSANGDFLRDQVDILVPELEKNNVEYFVKVYGDDDNVLSLPCECEE